MGAIVLVGISIKWSTFNSTLYPYSISQPSTFSHQVGTLGGLPADIFFANGLGSYTTNVNITAQRGNSVAQDLAVFRRQSDGTAKSVGWLRVMGHNLQLIRSKSDGLVGPWVEERVTFSAGGYTWRLTASYEPRYKRLRPTMLRMLASFKLH